VLRPNPIWGLTPSSGWCNIYKVLGCTVLKLGNRSSCMLLKTTGSKYNAQGSTTYKVVIWPRCKIHKKSTLPQLLGKSAIGARSHKKYGYATEENSTWPFSMICLHFHPKIYTSSTFMLFIHFENIFITCQQKLLSFETLSGSQIPQLILSPVKKVYFPKSSANFDCKASTVENFFSWNSWAI